MGIANLGPREQILRVAALSDSPTFTGVISLGYCMLKYASNYCNGMPLCSVKGSIMLTLCLNFLEFYPDYAYKRYVYIL